MERQKVMTAFYKRNERKKESTFFRFYFFKYFAWRWHSLLRWWRSRDYQSINTHKTPPLRTSYTMSEWSTCSEPADFFALRRLREQIFECPFSSLRMYSGVHLIQFIGEIVPLWLCQISFRESLVHWFHRWSSITQTTSDFTTFNKWGYRLFRQRTSLIITYRFY